MYNLKKNSYFRCSSFKNRQIWDRFYKFWPSKCGAIEIRNALDKKLQEFEINLTQDVVATTTDDPNVMKTFSNESPIENLFCLNHGFYVAVVDVLYVETTETLAHKKIGRRFYG